MYLSFGLLWRTLFACFMVGWHIESQAAATITFSQVGNDVQATISGFLDPSGLSYSGVFGNPSARVRGGGNGVNVVIGPTHGVVVKNYAGVTGPGFIGCSTATIDASSGSSTPSSGMFGINMSDGRLLLPQSYNTNDPIAGSATWNGATISSLGLTSGTYVYTWSGDSLTIVVPSGGASCVPMLSHWTQIMLALMVIGIAWHFHNNRQNSY